MLLRSDPPLHLTYCTNIHPEEGWAAVRATLKRVAPALKARLSPSAPFALGLRLGAREARELLDGNWLADFKAFLDDEGLYVAILNGFPYGPFHGAPVKTNVYAPDWRSTARVEYTRDLIHILAALLPEGVAGGISTVPLSYKAWMRTATPADWERLTANVIDVIERLVRVRADTGRVLHLDLEPEPDCLLETSAETAEFFEARLRPAAARLLPSRLGATAADAVQAVDEHVQVCFDCCHCAVEFEDPMEALARLRRAGIRIGRVQLSSALNVAVPADAPGARRVADRLAPFAESTYLHQVVERHGGSLRRFSDLDAALPETEGAADRQWRIHFHVPLFASEFDGLGSSQDVVRAVIAEAHRSALTQHLEIETYTWSVLPEGLRLELVDSIAREYEWVVGEWELSQKPRSKSQK